MYHEDPIQWGDVYIYIYINHCHYTYQRDKVWPQRNTPEAPDGGDVLALQVYMAQLDSQVYVISTQKMRKFSNRGNITGYVGSSVSPPYGARNCLLVGFFFGEN